MTNKVTPISGRTLNYSILPEHGREPMRRYIEQRVPAGSFLQSLLSNDLKMTYANADSINIKCIEDYVRFLYNHAPMDCWGSPDAYDNWLKGTE